MTPYRVSYQTKDYILAGSGGKNEIKIETRCNGIYVRPAIVTALGDVPGTGINFDKYIRDIQPRANGIMLYPLIVGEGGFSKPLAELQPGRNPEAVKFESPDQYGIIEEDLVLSCKVVVGYNFPLIVQVTRRLISFQNVPSLK